MTYRALTIASALAAMTLYSSAYACGPYGQTEPPENIVRMGAVPVAHNFILKPEQGHQFEMMVPANTRLVLEAVPSAENLGLYMVSGEFMNWWDYYGQGNSYLVVENTTDQDELRTLTVYSHQPGAAGQYRLTRSEVALNTPVTRIESWGNFAEPGRYISISMNLQGYLPQKTKADMYAAIDLGGQFYFLPSFSTTPDGFFGIEFDYGAYQELLSFPYEGGLDLTAKIYAVSFLHNSNTWTNLTSTELVFKP